MMWTRMRFDIGWKDLSAALIYCITPAKRNNVCKQVVDAWRGGDQVLPTMSVRSAFDLALRALALPAGSEVLLSALTVPDMVRIVEAHSLVPVAVDTDENGHIMASSLESVITPQSRMLVVAHLFGGVTPMSELQMVAKKYGLLVVEDCAQSFCSLGGSGHGESDLVMYSFGPIKTATALGGSVTKVRSNELFKRMTSLLSMDPIQSRISFAKRVLRFSMLKLLSGKLAAGSFRSCVELLGYDFDVLANSFARGFVGGHNLDQFRKRPSVPLLRLLRRRFLTYDFRRVERRIQLGKRMDQRLGIACDEHHTYWIYPLFVKNRDFLRDAFQQAGFDATCRARMTVVKSPSESHSPVVTSESWKHVLFIPWYPDLSDAAVEQMAEIVAQHAEPFSSSVEY